MKNDRLAVSAMEELFNRGDSDTIVEVLNKAFASGWMVKGSTLVNLIARSLSESARNEDPILHHYGRALPHEFRSPSEWIRAHADQYKKNPKSDAFKKAHPWAAIHIWPDEELRQAIKQADEELAARAKRQQLAADSFREFTETL